MGGDSFTELIILYLIVLGITQGHHMYFEREESNVRSSPLILPNIASLLVSLFNTLVMFPWYHVSIATVPTILFSTLVLLLTLPS